MTRVRVLLAAAVIALGLLLGGGAEGALNVVVVLDDSGSMQSRLRSNVRITRMDAAKEALVTVVEKLPADAKVGVLALNSRIGKNGHWIYPLAPVDSARFRAAVDRIEANGMTPLGGRLKDAADAILALREKQRYGDYRLLVVSDGDANDGNLLQRNLPEVLRRGIWMDVIGVDMAQGHGLATRVHTYRKADDPESLKRALVEVFAETTGDAGTAGESDFEIIKPIPDEMATAALGALARASNEPIGQRPRVETPAARPAAKSPTIMPPKPVPVMPRPMRGGDRGFIFNLGGVCCGAFVLVIILVIFSATKRRRGF